MFTKHKIIFLVASLFLATILSGISFDEIEYWVGEGENQSALVIDWQDDLEPVSLVWGFKWDGEKTGLDMIQAIVDADPRLEGSVDLPETIKYDINNDGIFEDGIDHIRTGNMNEGSYWPYYVGEDCENWNYATTTHAGRDLENGSCDGFSFCEDWNGDTFAPRIPVAAQSPETQEEITFENIQFWTGEGSSQAMLIIDWQTEEEIHSLAWGFNFTVLTDASEMLTAISENDSRLEVTYAGNFVESISFDENLDGEPEYFAENNETAYWNSFKKNDTEWITAGNMNTAIQNNERFGFAYGSLDNYSNLDFATPVEPQTFVHEFTFEDLEYWVGEGSNEAMLVIDWNDETDPVSLAWGFRFNESTTGEDIITAIANEDERLTVNMGSGFLNDLIYTTEDGTELHAGLGGNPDYWGTWSSDEITDWTMNSGLSQIIENQDRFGCSYGFNPEPTAPNTPIAVTIPSNNNAPLANEDNFSLKINTEYELDILINDLSEDSEIVGLEILTSPEHATIEILEDSKILFIPETDYSGTDLFSYKIENSEGILSEETSANINIYEPFAPNADLEGTTAISATSEEFVDWASSVEIERGFMNISNPDNGLASYGEAENANGQAEGTSTDVVSLGDAGIATATFITPIVNGEGYDFAIFENGFSNDFLELAFVEVSSNGVDFYRFPSISLTQNSFQVNEYGSLDAENIHNLAGKYRQGFGTPFDLEDLADISELDIDAITHVKIIDVIGSINPEFATFDSNGSIINDPWISESASCGFDLDGIGVLHNSNNVGNEDISKTPILYSAYPNPFNISKNRAGSTNIKFNLKEETVVNLTIFNIKGQKVKTLINEERASGEHIVTWNGKDNKNQKIGSGIYFYRLETNNFTDLKKITILK